MQTIQEITIDLTGRKGYEKIRAKQYDRNTRYAKVSLNDNGIPFSIPTATTVRAYFKKPDETEVTEICSHDGNTILIPLEYNTLAAAGAMPCDVELSQGNERLTAFTFIVEVEQAVRNDVNAMSSNQYSDLEKQYNSMVSTENDVKTAEAKRVTAESGRVSAENTRVSNENNRKTAETARATAESGRVSAESTRVSNENSRKTAETSRVTAEAARVEAESKRQTNTAAAITASEKATAAAQTVVDNAKNYESLTVATESKNGLMGKEHVTKINELNSNLAKKKDNKWSSAYNNSATVPTDDTAWYKMISTNVSNNQDYNIPIYVSRLYRSSTYLYLASDIVLRPRNNSGVIESTSIVPVITPNIPNNVTTVSLQQYARELCKCFKAITNGTTVELWCKSFQNTSGNFSAYDGWYWELRDNVHNHGIEQNNNVVIFEPTGFGLGVSEPEGITLTGQTAILDKTTQTILDLVTKYPI